MITEQLNKAGREFYLSQLSFYAFTCTYIVVPYRILSILPIQSMH